MSEWIPTSERLPELETSVLALVTLKTSKGEPWEPFMEILELYKDAQKETSGWTDEDSHYYDLADITHWMPLPEPPKETQISQKEGENG